MSMDNIKTGNFIAEKRKEKKLTQKALAEKIGVTDKAISKWERGLSYPDISLLIPLSEVLGVSVTELLNGDSIDKMEVELSDGIVVSSVQRYTKHLNQKNRKRFVAITLIFLILLSTSLVYGKIMERHTHVDTELSELLCEIELSYDYVQEFLLDDNPDSRICLDVATSNVVRFLERYRATMYVYYGEDMNNVERKIDALRDTFLAIHHAVPGHPHEDDAHLEDLEEGFKLAIHDIENLRVALEETNVYYGSEELMESIIENLKSKEVVS